MKLLDFPLEIFGVIILELVEEVGAADAMDLRNVCSKFPLGYRRARESPDKL